MARSLPKTRTAKLVPGFLAATCLCLAISSTGLSQDYDQGRYQNQMTRLSEILGRLHHLRGMCVSGEQQLWRDNMMELIRLENPPAERKNAMVAKFNSAYEAMQKSRPACGREANGEAWALAREGAELSDALAVNLSR